MKRDTSDMESDFDEVFTDDATKGSSIQTNNGSQLVTRKRRRGIIEKRRRDRINNSLSELRRLVPAAFEKQGSAKLEKAEILQMTVDHLRILHSKGFDMYGFDPNKYAMDYHNIGFRECVSEIARYLVGMEGMDLQDPLRLRLMSHLQCYAAQRDLALKSSSPWSPSSQFGLQPSDSVTSHYEPQTSAHLTSRGSSLQPITTTATSSTPPVNHYVGGYTSANSYVSPTQPSASVRPYRPWGAEMAY